ncbi:MAG TPA: class I tRNA ligase family protein, partial [Halanaerobiales bacterium]|nr:class I tRNA ligase family protein [Halanaerobiales bacterium]
GRKMSKSLGNGIDPIEVIEEYGADALRFTLITGNTPGNDMRFREERLEASRNFANKIWNASRFILMNLEDFDYNSIKEEDLKLNLADRWMLSRTNEVTQKIDDAMERYSFGEMSKSLYDFIWNEYCDWYIEILKERLYQDKDLQAKKTAQYMGLKILGNILKMLHPVMPMITEEIWQKLPISDKSIMVTSWPSYSESEIDKTAEEKMDLIMSVIKSVRNIRNEMKVDPGRKIEAILLAGSSKEAILQEGESYLKNLANIEDLTITESLEERPQPASTAIVEGVEVILPLEGMVDIEKELDRLQKELQDVEYEIERAKGKLNNEGFVNNAPDELVEGEREKVKEYQEKKDKLLDRIEQLKLN